MTAADPSGLPAHGLSSRGLPVHSVLRTLGFPLVQDPARMLRLALLLTLVVSSLGTTGCKSLQKKHENPVMVEAPRRVERIENDDDDDEVMVAQNSDEEDSGDLPEDDGSDITQVRASLDKNPWAGWEDDTTIFNSQVAATVNGAPILNGDVLDRYSGYLISVREQMQAFASDPKNQTGSQQLPSPDDYEKLRYSLIQRDIVAQIQKKVLVERMKGSLKPDQMKQMNGHIDQLFEKEVEKLKKDLQVTNKTELELELNKKGTTLQNVKDNFALDRLSMEYFVAKSEKPDPIERPDLVAYYKANPDKFLVPATVKWQQIQVSVTPETSKSAAMKKLQEAIDELNQGVSFDKVARKYSDGPTANDGGLWDWMETGNLADTKLEKKLFEMPVKKLSEVHEGRDSVCVVRVIGRKEASRKPFEDVYEEIRETLTEERNKNRPKKLLKELFANAVIETQYSIPDFASE
ncbi:peptidylprolyl isomerase [Schlesneria sp. T3-172]|uniref:peptidylprolyl isomerase n=1 Tax=Schlesneria sphaerica TaxID=3373610 RepID=UPI0037C9F938